MQDTPSASSTAAASLHAASILPTPTRHTSVPERTLRPRRPAPTSSSATWGAAVFDQRIDTGPVVISRASCSICCTSWYDDGAKIVMPGTFDMQHHVEHAVVRRAVVAGDAGPVEAEHDGLAVQADVEVGLVEGPGEERRVEGDDGSQAAHRHAGG